MNLITEAIISKFVFTVFRKLQIIAILFNFFSPQTFIKSTLAKLSDNPYGWWTSLNDKETEGYWSFGDAYMTDTSLV